MRRAQSGHQLRTTYIRKSERCRQEHRPLGRYAYISTFMLEEEKTIAEYSDEELLERSVDEPGYFSALVDRYQKAFLRKADSILRSKDQADEAVQDAFVKIYKYAHTFRPTENGSFRAWAYRILVNHCFSLYRKNERERERVAHLEPDHYTNLSESPEFYETEVVINDYVTSVFTKIPDQLARMLRLYFIDRLSQKEIAEKENLSLVAVRVRMYRAKHAFRKASAELE